MAQRQQQTSNQLNRSIKQHTINQNQLRIEIDEQHRLGFVNWIPLILVILPNLAPIFLDGEPESWRRSLIFLLVVYFLYKISKAPWQLYASARTTRIFNQLGVNPNSKIIYPTQSHSHQASLTELNRIEIAFLLLAMSSPAIGIGLLLHLQSKLDFGLDYLNSQSTVLFLLASLVKPLGHLHDRVLQRARYLQSQLEFPAQSAEQFNESFQNLAFKLNQLESESLTKTDLSEFKKNQIDLKLMEISNRLSHFEKSDQIYQSDSFDRISRLERALVETREKLEKTEISSHHLLVLNHRHSSPLDSISKALTQIINPHHQPKNKTSNNTRSIDQKFTLTPLGSNPDHPASLSGTTASSKIVKKPHLIEHGLNPMNIQNSTNLSDQLISNFFRMSSGLETIKSGLEVVARQILYGIRYPIATFIKILSYSFTLFLSLCLILNPIQILRLVTKTRTNNIQSGTDYHPVRLTQPIETLRTMNDSGDGYRRRPRHHPSRRPSNQHHHRYVKTPSTTHNLDLPAPPSPPPSALSSSSSSEHQSPPLNSPPPVSNPFDTSPHQIHQHLHPKITHPHLTRIDSSDSNSLYHLNP